MKDRNLLISFFTIFMIVSSCSHFRGDLRDKGFGTSFFSRFKKKKKTEYKVVDNKEEYSKFIKEKNFKDIITNEESINKIESNLGFRHKLFSYLKGCGRWFSIKGIKRFYIIKYYKGRLTYIETYSLDSKRAREFTKGSRKVDVKNLKWAKEFKKEVLKIISKEKAEIKRYIEQRDREIAHNIYYEDLKNKIYEQELLKTGSESEAKKISIKKADVIYANILNKETKRRYRQEFNQQLKNEKIAIKLQNEIIFDEFIKAFNKLYLQKIPRSIYKNKAIVCKVCLENFKKEDLIYRCKGQTKNKLKSKSEKEESQHIFHKNCINPWFFKKRGTYCPLRCNVDNNVGNSNWITSKSKLKGLTK